MKPLPQFSLRLMLSITALTAGFFSIVGLALRGHGWAIGVSLGVAGLLIAFGTYAAFFGLLWVFSVAASPMLDRRVSRRTVALAGTSSPFAGGPRAGEAESPVEAILVDSGNRSGEARSMEGERGA